MAEGLSFRSRDANPNGFVVGNQVNFELTAANPAWFAMDGATNGIPVELTLAGTTHRAAIHAPR
jgi:hypothetical protein